ncbi:hypothetical protein ACM46_13390 [Chryseobacterium angstadtii]|uniref:YD repeat-containing protein n=2 Tax=Chryseobacterium angstadtii TaxID=558151 RepID=A0A0J7IAL5_9FLAO|nr:hypothetical protein ACM46_13390 [Chryseobacterium angstadtii]
MVETLNAQQSLKIIPNVIAPNLDASALGTFDKQAVNLSTGTPNIEILFHTIRIGDLELPIKLKYDASGIKVGQIATSVGLGWCINNMGVLTQEVRDKIDGQSNNIIQQYINTNTVAGRNDILYNHQYVTQPYTGDDLETDNYNINYFGNTIPFFYNYVDNTYISQQKDDTKITRGINKWTVTLNDGTEFNFNQQFSQKSVSATTIKKSPQQTNQAVSSPNVNDTWYLTGITNRGQIGSFTYDNSSNIYISKGTENYDAVSVIRNTESFKLIKEIVTPFEKVVFEYSPEREDLISNNGKADLLKFIKIYDNYGKLIKQFQLYYDYYNETEALPNYASAVANNGYKNKRLRLKEVKRLKILDGSYENYYAFSYNSDTLPNRFSASQDLWGYYNGENNGDYMFSNTEVKNISIAPSYSSNGLLNKITYPTGGFTEYIYENNESARPDNYDLMIPEAMEAVSKSIRLNRLPIFYKGNGKYEIPFTVDAPILNNLFNYQINISNCPGTAYSTTCDYKIMIDGSWINPGTGTATGNILTVGSHNLTAQANNHTEDPDNYDVPYFFSAGIQWKEKKPDIGGMPAPILVGGQRVKKVIHNDAGNKYIEEFVYAYENGITSGSILTLPYIGSVGTYGPIYSQGSNPLFKLKGQNLVYRRVEKTQKDVNGFPNGKTVHYFSKAFTNNNFNRLPFPPPDDISHTYGHLNKEEFFEFKNGIFNKIEENNYFYTYPEKCIADNSPVNCKTILKGLSYSDVVNITNTGATINTNFDWGIYTLEASPFKLLSKVSTKYYNNISISTREEMDYNSSNHNNLTSNIATFPDQSIKESTYKYAHEKGNQLMIDKNMIGIPLETSTTQTNGSVTKMLSKTETIYPKTAAEITNNNFSLVLPKSALSYDLQNPTVATTEVTYDVYDSKGNLQQYTGKNRVSTTIIWGYNQTQPIAKIEGAKLSDISQSLIDAIVTVSVNDAQQGTNASEQSLIDALNTFRNNTALSSYQISTYTYDPLIGVKSITPPSGIREVYIYDTANRLEKVVDVNGKIIKEYKYNYKN